jgi:hypothetical protein
MFSKSFAASARDPRRKMNPANANLKIPRRVTVMRLLPLLWQVSSMADV